MDDTLNGWYNLACAMLHRAVLDARQPSATQKDRIGARLFLMSPQAEWVAGGVGLDIQAIRDKALRQWIERQ